MKQALTAWIELEALANADAGNVINDQAIQAWADSLDTDSSAGPLLLLWRNAHPGSIDSVKWPYWIRKFEVKGDLKELYPAIFPKSKKYTKGFQLFLQNCFSCHTLNKQGTATLGQDLNYPHSPTEYFKDAYLRKLIREPSSLRHWTNSKMGSFSESILSNKELNALLEYLKHMSKNKVDQGLLT